MRPHHVLVALAPVVLAGSTVDLPCTPPEGSYTIDPSFPNLSFEFASLLLFAQTSAEDTSPNEYTINLLNNIYRRSGGHPILRVGGTSGDFVRYNASQSAPVDPVPGYGSGQDTFGTTIGPGFWPVTKNLASTGAQYIPQVSIAFNNITEVQVLAQAAIEGIGMEWIDSMEIGNEVDLLPNGQTGSEYTTQLNNTSYSDRFRAYAAAIASAIPIDPSAEPFFQAGDFADGDSRISVGGTLEANITAGGYIKTFADHYYQLVGNDTAYADLLDHGRTVNQSSLQKAYIADLQALDPVIPFYMDEVNVLTGPVSFPTTQSLAAAVWMVDYMLYGMTIGMNRVHWESVFASHQAIFQPSASNGKVAGTGAGYYSLPATAEFIGDTGGTSSVAQIAVDGSVDNDRYTAYASYNGSTLARVALLNLNPWSEGDSSTRPNITFDLAGLKDTAQINVKYLDGPNGASSENSTLTYGGSQWTYESTGNEVKGVRDDTLTVLVCNDTASVAVPATSVAMVFLVPN